MPTDAIPFDETYNSVGIATGTTSASASIPSLSTVYNSVSDPTATQSLTAGYITGDISSANFQTGVAGWKLSYLGDFEGNNGTFRGTIYASGGVIGGFTITSTVLYGGIIKTAASVGAGSTGVIMDTAGLRGYDSVLGNTFNLPTNGSAPTFSSGIINSTVFNVNTSAVIQTSTTVGDGSSSSAGILINNTGFYACQANQLLANANVKILIDGSATFSGTITSSTINSSTIQTATSGVRAVISSSTNDIKIYDTTPQLRMAIGGTGNPGMLFYDENGVQGGGIFVSSTSFSFGSNRSNVDNNITAGRLVGPSDFVTLANFMPYLNNTSNIGQGGGSPLRIATIYLINNPDVSSSIELKKNVKSINYGLDTILQLQPIEFEWKDQIKVKDKGKRIGFIAEHIKKIIPEASPEEGSYRPADLIPILIKSIQELNDKIIKLEKK